jgi:hypothetical protein
LYEDFGHILNFEVHGAYNSAELNMSADRAAYASGPNSQNLPEFSSIARLVQILISQLLFEVYKAMPRLLGKRVK